MNSDLGNVSIIIPAKNEAANIGALVNELVREYPSYEILVVDDGSSDETAQLAKAEGAIVLSHPYSMGNGASIKTGARAAKGDILVFMDGDGQHVPSDIPRLLDRISNGYDMVVGARTKQSQASGHRRLANGFYNRLASFMTRYQVDDLTSGFRAAKSKHFKKFLYLLPNGFSYPTTSTMAFFRSGLAINYVPIEARQRTNDSKSHIRIFRDGFRFFLIILKVGALFSPMRFFLPISALLFGTGVLYYSYTYFNFGTFTNMSALLFISALQTFLIGIISEQVSSLHYRGVEED